MGSEMPWTVGGMRDDYDWQRAFEYAGGGLVPDSDGHTMSPEGNAGGSVPHRCEGATCSEATFNLGDVDEVLAADAGENDGAEWVAVVKLTDGRYAYLEAGCDYTGWDCQAGGSVWVSEDLHNLWRFGVTEGTRTRLAAQMDAYL